MRQMKVIVLFLCMSSLLSACMPAKNKYHWGSYESLILDMYVKPGSADPVTQVAQLTADIQQADSLGKPVPPGIFAHLGFMYAMQNNIEQAEASFHQEKSLYPESSEFLDGMMKRAREVKAQ